MQLEDYLSLFPGATRGKERFMALAEAVLRQATDLAALAVSLPSGFSFAGAEGVQLDAVAEAAGLRRGAGMTDGELREYLLAKTALWSWDGTNEGTPPALPAGVTMTDNGNGTVTVSPPGTPMEILPVPAGVRVTD